MHAWLWHFQLPLHMHDTEYLLPAIPDCIAATHFAYRSCTGWQLSSMTRGTSAYSIAVPQPSWSKKPAATGAVPTCG